MDWLIVWLMMTNLVSNSAYSMLAPFYPDIAEEERGMSSFLVGMVMSSASVSSMFTAFFIGQRLGKIGRRRAMYGGIYVTAACIVGFGALIWIKDRTLFIIASFTFRIIGGISWAFVNVATYAMTSIKYSDNVQAKITLLEAANGAGLFIGPIFGGIIYQFTSFWVPFFLFAGIYFVFPIFMRKSFTPDLDIVDEKEQTEHSVTNLKMIKHSRVLFAGITQFFNILVVTMGSPVFSPRFRDAYGFSSSLIGVCFGIPTLFYIITGLAVLPYLRKYMSSRVSIWIGLAILAASSFLIGPSKMLGMPDTSAALMIIGLCLLGFGWAWTILPVIPEMLDSIKGKYEDQMAEVNDIFSGIFNVGGSFGQVVGPSLAGLLNDEVGFNLTFDIIALILIAFLVLYLIIWGGLNFLLNYIKKRKEDKSGSPKHRLLEDEQSNTDDDSVENDEEIAFTKNGKADNDSMDKSANSISTINTSLGNENNGNYTSIN